MKVAGFFAGVGGIELGFLKAGFDVVYSNEIDKNAVTTFKLNHNTNIVCEDIYNINPKDVPNVDIIVAGFPCQAFSIAGNRKGFLDSRGSVFFELARIIKDKLPRVVFLENVKNLLTHNKGNSYKTIKETLENLGYNIKTYILNACDYANLPQNRERIYIIGFLKQNDLENFKDIEPIKLNKKIADIIDFNKKVDDKFYYTKENCIFFDELKDNIKKTDTMYQWRRKYIRENKSNLCPTLTANMGTGGHNVPILLTKHGIRKLTPKECFLLQGFCENFKLPKEVATSHLYKQAGNSVAIPVVYRLAKRIKETLSNHNNYTAKNR